MRDFIENFKNIAFLGKKHEWKPELKIENTETIFIFIEIGNKERPEKLGMEIRFYVSLIKIEGK